VAAVGAGPARVITSKRPAFVTPRHPSSPLAILLLRQPAAAANANASPFRRKISARHLDRTARRLSDARPGRCRTLCRQGKEPQEARRVVFSREPPSPRIALMVAQIAAIETTATRIRSRSTAARKQPDQDRWRRATTFYFATTNPIRTSFSRKNKFQQTGFLSRKSDDRKADYFGPLPLVLGGTRQHPPIAEDVSPAHLRRHRCSTNRSRPCLLYQIKRCSGALCRPRFPGATMQRMSSSAPCS
jgi:hypothetical protein